LFIPAEGRKLLLGLPARLIPSAAVGLFTPIRTAEIERLDWCHVNLKEGHIEIKARNAKKRIRRIVPIPPNLKLWLSPFAKAFGKVCPFTRLTNQWNKFAVRAGVRWSRNVHRDSGISYTVALKRNVAEVSLISGNSPEVIRNNYLKCVTLEQAKAWFAIRPPKDWKPKREPQLKMLTKKIPT
jgi:integrase